ncbi:MAG: PepSY-like domain-containing protein [Bacteroidales bacterium]|nr:PepSY-like domain-containing protein [Bacteroidales bacterium]
MRHFAFIAFAISMFMALCACYDDKRPITFTELPKYSQSFVKTYFSDKQVSAVFKEIHGKNDYEVFFNDGAQIEFTRKGDWDEVKDRDTDGIPTGFLPKAMVNHVATNFSGANIIEINKEHSRFEVELSNGIELVFDLNGNFLRYDD